jgi:hypothetical protein
MLMMDPSRLPTGAYDPNNPVVYYLISSGNGQNMMMFMPNDQLTQAQASGQDVSQANSMMPPSVMIAAQGDQNGQPLSISYVPASSLAQGVVLPSVDGSKLDPTQNYALQARRTDVPGCSACGALGKQIGRAGSRIKEGFCLCANCEDRAKRYKKDGLRKGSSFLNSLFHCAQVFL